MLQRPAKKSEYLTADGRICMAHVMREAHRRTKAQLATEAKRGSVSWTYARTFREKVTSELATARIMKREHFPALVDTSRVRAVNVTFQNIGGKTYRFNDGICFLEG